MIDQETPTTPPKPYGFLDLLVTLAEAHRVLILGPLLVGLLTFGAVWIMTGDQASFDIEAEAILSQDTVSEINLTSAAEDVRNSLELAVSAVTVRSRLSVGPEVDGNRKVTLRWDDAEQGQIVLQALINAATANISQSTSRQVAVLEDKIAVTQTQIDLIARWSEQFSEDLGQAGTAAPEADAFSLLRAMDWGLERSADLSRTQTGLEAELARLERNGSIVSQPPFVVEAVPSQRPTLIRALPYLAGLAAFAVLLVFVFAREAARRARQEPATLAKFGRIRQAFWPW